MNEAELEDLEEFYRRTNQVVLGINGRTSTQTSLTSITFDPKIFGVKTPWKPPPAHASLTYATGASGTPRTVK